MANFSGLFDTIVPSGATPGYTPVSSKKLSLSSGAVIDKNGPDMTRLSKVLRKRGMKKLNLYLNQLLGAAAGSVNSGNAFTESRVAHPTQVVTTVTGSDGVSHSVTSPLSVGAFGRSASASQESVNIIEASTSSTATDVTNIKAGLFKIFSLSPSDTPTQPSGVDPVNHVEDSGGNGGGGRLTAKYSVK